MPLTNKQIASLLDFVASSEDDPGNCEDCLRDLAVFAEAELTSSDLSDAMAAVSSHLKQCHCCREEFEMLLEGLQALQMGEDNEL